MISNSAGDLNEQQAHLKRAQWLDQSGPVAQDKWGGIAFLEHPDNPRSPTGWHCRNDGWACASFTMEAPYTLESDAKLNLRYRIISHRDDADRAAIAKRYNEYARKPSILLSSPVKAVLPEL